MFDEPLARLRGTACAVAVAATIATVPLAACGVKGPLKLPPPTSPATSEKPAVTPAASAPQPDERKP